MESPRLWTTALLVTMLSGCVAPAGTRDLGVAAASAADDPIVVAVIDSGINPYYELFTGPQRLPPEVFATEVNLAKEGDLNKRLETDGPFWETAEFEHLYHFEGTRAYAIGFTDRRPYRLFDTSAHGATVNYLVAREAPRAVVVSIHVFQGACELDTPCLWDPSVPAAMEWAADQPWIDIITVSMGPPGNPPDPSPEMTRWVEASQRAAASGKILTSAAGNDPSPSAASPFVGPPWFIAVGGAQPAQRGEQIDSSRLIDVVSNYSESLPSGTLDGTMRGVEGTSFATPIVAGTLGAALDLLRAVRPGSTATPTEMRAALNATAVVFSTTEWRPRPLSVEDPFSNTAKASLPVVTQAQMGWGYVNGSLAPEIARRVLDGDLEAPAGKDEAILVQAQYQRAREEYWANWPR